MATVDDVLAGINHVKECTGDPKAWLTGLTPQDATYVVTLFGASPQRLDALLAKIRQQHPDLFDPATGTMIFPPTRRPGAPSANPPPGAPPPDHQEGAAADAIRDAETALAHQNSASAQLDLQVVTAILNAHQKSAEDKEALDKLQHDIETAIQTRSDLDTPAGARDFQRFLIGKLKEIRAVVTSARLDDTSESALMAAWTSLYNASKGGQDDPSQRRPPAVAAPSPRASSEPQSAPDATMDPYLDSPPADDPGYFPGDASAQSPPATAPTAAPAAPNIPGLGGGGTPGGGAMPGFGAPGGFAGPLQGSGKQRLPTDPEEAAPAADDLKDGPSPDDTDAKPDDEATESPAPESPAGPTTVTLPNGETVTAASPQLAAAIKAAAEGAPIADAFRQQGITIPPPGTAVASPVDPAQVRPGDIGMFTDRHALGLGNSKALLNGQIQHISTVTGPSFLGWERPPAPATVAAPTRTGTPTPTHPATAAGT